MAEQRKLTTISLTSELFDKIEKYRWDHHMNRSEFFVNAVKTYMQASENSEGNTVVLSESKSLYNVIPADHAHDIYNKDAQ